MTDRLPRVAVTGAGGFIGRAVAARLAADGHPVTGLDLRPVEGLAGVDSRVVDITDAAALRAAMADCDGVVHTAAVVTDWGKMDDFVRVNVRGTRNVLDALDDRGPAVHVGSVAGWGYEFAHDLDEDAWTRRVGAPYVDTKAASQELALRRGAAVVRPGDVYGPGSVPWTLRPLETLRARSFVLPGRGDGVMTPIYVDDLVDCVVRALHAPDAAGVAFTAHDGAPVAARDFFGHDARMLGRRRVPTAPRPLVSAGALALELAARARGKTPPVSRQAIQYVARKAAYPNVRARHLLGWEPRVALADGMARTERWLKDTGRL
jgi:nucleoside-diphosphate-sugar epimerase